MEENKTERIEHATTQQAIDYAIDRVLIGVETVVYLGSAVQQSVTFKPRKKVPAVVQQRIGDSLRDHYLDLLRLAYAQGFIIQQEWDQRAGAALAATTRAELEPLTRDLDEVKRAEPKIVPHRHKSCVGLPVVIMLICIAIFVTAAISLIILAHFFPYPLSRENSPW